MKNQNIGLKVKVANLTYTGIADELSEEKQAALIGKQGIISRFDFDGSGLEYMVSFEDGDFWFFSLDNLELV